MWRVKVVVLKIFSSRSMISHDRDGKDWISDTKTAANSTLNFRFSTNSLFFFKCIISQILRMKVRILISNITSVTGFYSITSNIRNG